MAVTGGELACKMKAEYSNAFLLIAMLRFGAGWPSFAWEKSKYMASFGLFWSLLLSSPDLFRLNTFEHYKNIKRAYLLCVNIFMKSNYSRELKESRVETQELSHILQFALLASLAKAKASPGPKTSWSMSRSCCHAMAAGRSSRLLPCLRSPPFLT